VLISCFHWMECRKKCGKVKTDYKRDYFHSNIDVDFDFAGPVIHGAWVLGYITLVLLFYAMSY